MGPMIVAAEKIVAVAVLLTAGFVGYLTIHHGDLSLGLLVLLSQVQTLFGGHAHADHEAAHIAVHKKL